MNNIEWGLAFALAVMIASLSIAIFSVVLMPPTYFMRTSGGGTHLPAVVRWSLRILKNVLGAILIGAGAVMLVTPGQGILTILIGIALLDFPGKRTLERRLIRQRGVLKAMNRLRARFGRPPLVLDRDGR